MGYVVIAGIIYLLIIWLVLFIGKRAAGHRFHSPESYSYNEDGSKREGGQRFD